jgi:hypothetical protein
MNGSRATAWRRRVAARAWPGRSPVPVPTRANASASRSSGIAKLGIEQPSMPRGALARSWSVAACSASVTARITGWRGAT